MMAAFAGGVVDQINNNGNGNIRQLFCEIEVNSAWQNFRRQEKHGREQFLKWNYSPILKRITILAYTNLVTTQHDTFRKVSICKISSSVTRASQELTPTIVSLRKFSNSPAGGGHCPLTRGGEPIRLLEIPTPLDLNIFNKIYQLFRTWLFKESINLSLG